MPIPFIATEISGLVYSEYPSAATSKKYVDAISGALDTRIDTLEGYDEFDHELYITSANALVEFAGSSELLDWKNNVTKTEMGYLDGVSSDIQDQIDTKLFNNADDSTTGVITAHGFIGALSGSKVSANTMLFSGTQINTIFDEDDMASDAADGLATQQSIKAYIDNTAGGTGPSTWTAPTAGDGITLTGVGKISGALEVKVTDYIASANALATFAGSSAMEPVKAWFVASAQALSAYQASGDEWSAAYASAQLLEEGAFRKVATGWESVSDEDTIAHTLGAVPKHVTLTPSGNVTFATAFTVDATNITVRISAAGSRVVNWRAEV